MLFDAITSKRASRKEPQITLTTYKPKSEDQKSSQADDIKLVKRQSVMQTKIDQLAVLLCRNTGAPLC